MPHATSGKVVSSCSVVRALRVWVECRPDVFEREDDSAIVDALLQFVSEAVGLRG